MKRECLQRTRRGCAAAFLASLLTMTALPVHAAQPPRVAIQAEEPVAAPEGHAVISWRLEEPSSGVSFEVEQATRADFSDAVSHQVGPALSRFFTGLPRGENWIRVRATRVGSEPGPWSEPAKIEVDYPPLATVWPLMALGLALLVATALLIYVGHRRAYGGTGG